MQNSTRSTALSRQMKAVLAGVLALAGALFAAAQSSPRSETAVVSIPLLPIREMPDADARRAADSQPEVARSAAIYGYTLDSSFGYKEIACPFAPKDILLSYESAQPNGSVSRFTAIVPREAEGAISRKRADTQIIPITHYGTVPFLPASSNPHTFELFNRVVTVAPVGRELAKDANNDPLLLRSLCYLAMIGEPPSALRTPSLDPATIRAPVPTLGFQEKGIAREVLSIRNRSDTYQVWTLTFGQKGRLLAAERVEHPIDTTAPIVNEVAASPGVTTVPVAANSTASTTASVNARATSNPVAAAASVAATPAATPNAIPPAPTPAVNVTAPSTPAVAAASAAPTPGTASNAKPATPLGPSVPPMPAAAGPMIVAAVRSPVTAKVVPQPPLRLLSNLPPPPSRIIPASAMSYPPQAPEK